MHLPVGDPEKFGEVVENIVRVFAGAEALRGWVEVALGALVMVRLRFEPLRPMVWPAGFDRVAEPNVLPESVVDAKKLAVVPATKALVTSSTTMSHSVVRSGFAGSRAWRGW